MNLTELKKLKKKLEMEQQEYEKSQIVSLSNFYFDHIQQKTICAPNGIMTKQEVLEKENTNGMVEKLETLFVAIMTYAIKNNIPCSNLTLESSPGLFCSTSYFKNLTWCYDESCLSEFLEKIPLFENQKDQKELEGIVPLSFHWIPPMNQQPSMEQFTASGIVRFDEFVSKINELEYSIQMNTNHRELSDFKSYLSMIFEYAPDSRSQLLICVSLEEQVFQKRKI